MNEKQIVYNTKYIPEISIYRISKIKDPKEKVAKDVIAGKYGVYPQRKTLLEKAGYDYEVIQGIVGAMLDGTYTSSFNKKYCDFSVKDTLLSMSFTLSVNDITGSFSLTLFPEDNGISVFDNIQIMDIVEIREPSNVNNQASRPVFTGVVKTKKFITQTDGSGGLRRVSISGMAVTGLVSQFKINLDTTAMAITKQFKEQGNLNRDFTLKYLGEKNLKVADVVKNVWNHFLDISSQDGMGTPKIAEYIEATMGTIKEMFAFDDSAFYYPLGCIFNGEQTQDFFSLIDGVMPSPMYEKFAYMGADGRMKIMIRQVPFDSDKWSGFIQSRESGKGKTMKVSFDTKLLKSFELSQSDNEVYTVFYAYLNGYPVDEQKMLKLSTMEEFVDDTLITSDEYKTYGYKPLICHFIGYGMKDGEKDSDSISKMKDVTKKLKDWFSNLQNMFSGSMTISMSYQNGVVIMPGDVLLFLKNEKTQKYWAEFYVEGITHSWNYGQGGEINLTVSRGGKYNNGEFDPVGTKSLEVGKLSVLMESIQK